MKDIFYGRSSHFRKYLFDKKNDNYRRKKNEHKNFYEKYRKKRERYVKHFQMKEKGTAAAVYAVPVHYEENGNWQEIDNRLESAVQGGKRVYQNKASRVHVCFAEQAGDEKLVSVEKDGKELSWTMETASVMSERGDAKGSQGISTQRNVKAGSFQVLSEPEFPKNPEE